MYEGAIIIINHACRPAGRAHKNGGIGSEAATHLLNFNLPLLTHTPRHATHMHTRLSGSARVKEYGISFVWIKLFRSSVQGGDNRGQLVQLVWQS